MGVWQVDGEEPQGDWKWDQEEEKPGGIRSVGKEKVNIIDEDGYELVKRHGKLGQRMAAEIFAGGGSGGIRRKHPQGVVKEKIVRIKLLEACRRGGCKGKFGVAPESLREAKTVSVEKVIKNGRGE